MADDENIEIPDYEDMKRDDDAIDVNTSGVILTKSRTQAEKENATKSDFDIAQDAITPKFADPRQEAILQPILKQRTLPEMFLDEHYLLTMMMIEEKEGDDDIDILGILTGNQAALSVSYQGMHIDDILDLYGAQRQAELEKLSKEFDF